MREPGEHLRGAFRRNLERLDRAQSSQRAYWYTAKINRPLARYVAAASASVGISADAVTLISFGLHLVGVLLIATSGMGMAAAVGAYLLLAVAYVLDSADGQAARLTNTASRAGEWLDHTVDIVKLVTFHAAIGYHLLGPQGASFSVQSTFIVVAVAITSQASLFLGQTLYNHMSKSAPPASRAKSDGGSLSRLALFPLDWGITVMIVLIIPAREPFAVLYPVFTLWLLLATLAKSVRYYSLLRRI